MIWEDAPAVVCYTAQSIGPCNHKCRCHRRRRHVHRRFGHKALPGINLSQLITPWLNTVIPHTVSLHPNQRRIPVTCRLALPRPEWQYRYPGLLHTYRERTDHQAWLQAHQCRQGNINIKHRPLLKQGNPLPLLAKVDYRVSPQR